MAIDFLSYNKPIIEEFRANAGVVGGDYEGLPLALLVTKGAKTGKDRVSPVSYIADGDRVVVTATNAGLDYHPQWYHNLCADPNLTVEVGPEKYAAVAREVDGEERERLWEELVASNRRLGRYQSKTTRPIPVLVVERKAA
ncbi:nitroreductase/quinone reductase family protein [Amycolatopsis sp. NPDC026612]|jgi:deazaflavin-dependent oxidoreductase (nitroreductase family)|uniref:nitroreductase/quinone reductase family protein n=1 Tax=Amycolatopsis sp. NPDC026612 TaxID=3155466 RepID=UPI0033CF5AF5